MSAVAPAAPKQQPNKYVRLFGIGVLIGVVVNLDAAIPGNNYPWNDIGYPWPGTRSDRVLGAFRRLAADSAAFDVCTGGPPAFPFPGP